jgi:type III restriction enzyme
METGTGKTYVYLRTIFELHKNYGFSKFIIVVPSIAIKEGVYKSLEMTKDHFKALFDNTVYNYFFYDSSVPEQVRSFAVSDNIEIMVINIDAFRKGFDDPTKESKANIIHRPHDKLNGMKPIELIQETRPFVIIDEPQSVDTTPKSKEAIKSLHPLCTLRYSATHVEKHNLVYKLDAVDSYNLQLVKQIEVAGFFVKDYHNQAYMKLLSVDNKKSPITAKIELDTKDKKGVVKRKAIAIKKGDDLYEKSGRREIYEGGYLVDEISCEVGNEYVAFTSKADILRIGKAIGDVDDLKMKEQQIKKTIEEHLDKELVLNKQGIKVLSLFFIDRVANYRTQDEAKNPQKGVYATLFEKHYTDLIQRPKYASLREYLGADTAVEEVHNGYFSTMKERAKSTDKTAELKDTNGKTATDDDAYNLIMKEKELLLSFDSKLRFIFSHTALREGWDNPNVFQICTLNETKSTVKKRQEIGRGMRLCVNQEGVRQHGFAINTLTVIANESYEDFAKALQKEYEEESGVKFGVIERHSFAKILVAQADGTTTILGQERSEVLYQHFKDSGYIDHADKVQDALKMAIKNNDVQVPAGFEPMLPDITALARKACSTLPIQNNRDKKPNKVNKQVYFDPEFTALWDRIKYKTTYSVDFDSEKLIEACCEAMRSLSVSLPKFINEKRKIDMNIGGLVAEEIDRYAETLDLPENIPLPDIIAYLQHETNLTRKTIVEILLKSKTVHLFQKNPQSYMEQVAEIVRAQMRQMSVDGIKYTKIGDSEYYAQEMFEEKELTGYLTKNMIESKKSVYEYVVYDSGVEESFATGFESNKGVKLYAKLPDWFKIQTPLGTYTPDWAVLIDREGKDKLYFVLETKGNTRSDALRPTESAKIKCGEKHFAAMGNGGSLKLADRFEDFIEEVTAT